jgi:hypothetical protein
MHTVTWRIGRRRIEQRAGVPSPATGGLVPVTESLKTWRFRQGVDLLGTRTTASFESCCPRCARRCVRAVVLVISAVSCALPADSVTPACASLQSHTRPGIFKTRHCEPRQGQCPCGNERGRLTPTPQQRLPAHPVRAGIVSAPIPGKDGCHFYDIAVVGAFICKPLPM